jgi:hypothetical protein
MTELFPEFFRRHDERPDAVFYETPREGSHIDDRPEPRLGPGTGP